jgi:(2Fe-2S) ferredoxin
MMPTDPKERTTPGYERHVFVCGHERPEGASRPSCSKRGSLELMRLLKTSAKEAGLTNVRVQKSGCLDFCEFGTTCVVYPESIWYSIPGKDAIPDILEHLRSGIVAEKHLLNLEK